jgi:hypothetical protein
MTAATTKLRIGGRGFDRNAAVLALWSWREETVRLTTRSGYGARKVYVGKLVTVGYPMNGLQSAIVVLTLNGVPHAWSFGSISSVELVDDDD